MRHLAVEQEEALDILLQHAFPVETDRRNTQAFLIDMRMAAIGEVGMVGGVDGPGHKPVLNEDRRCHDDIGQVSAAPFIGIIADEDVAGLDVFQTRRLHQIRDEADEAAEMHRDMLGLAEHCAIGVEECRRAVAAFLDIGGIAGADQRFAHFLDGRSKSAGNHFNGNRIDGRGLFLIDVQHHFASSMRLR
ncbi:hypothetical protein D3C71_904800 [compost metagenome]